MRQKIENYLKQQKKSKKNIMRENDKKTYSKIDVYLKINCSTFKMLKMQKKYSEMNGETNQPKQ